jgi:hypothetical protein
MVKNVVLAIRFSQDEDAFFESQSNKYNLKKADLFRFCLYKTLINNKITLKEWKKKKMFLER